MSGNILKSILNERRNDEWFLESGNALSDIITEHVNKVASEAVESVLMSDEPSAYIGTNQKLGNGIYVSIFIDNYVLYFDINELFEDPSFSDVEEVEAVSAWFKEKHEELEKYLREKKEKK